MKQCRKCEETKPLDEFYKCHEGKFGRLGICKPCERERALSRYYDNRPQYLELTKTPEWRELRRARSAFLRQREALNRSPDCTNQTATLVSDGV